MEDISSLYFNRIQKAEKAYPSVRFYKNGKVDEKQLEFFKGLANNFSSVSENIMASGYDQNKITELEKILSEFNTLYNAYYQEVVRRPESRLSVPMREIMDKLRSSLNKLAERVPQYANVVKKHLIQLDNMYVRTGGKKGGRKCGGSQGLYPAQDFPQDTYFYEPSLIERINATRPNPLSTEQYKNYRYSSSAFNNDAFT